MLRGEHAFMYSMASRMCWLRAWPGSCAFSTLRLYQRTFPSGYHTASKAAPACAVRGAEREKRAANAVKRRRLLDMVGELLVVVGDVPRAITRSVPAWGGPIFRGKIGDARAV